MASQQLNQKKCLNEKKRREQESVYMEELAEYIAGSSDVVGSFALMKQDKCAILQETIAQVRSISDQDEAVDVVSSSKASTVDILTNDVVGPLLLEALNGFLFIINSESTVQFISENVDSYLKFTQGELVGTSLYNLVHEDDHIQLSEYLRRAFAVCSTVSSKNRRTCSSNCRLLVNSSDCTDKRTNKLYINMQIIGLCHSIPASMLGLTQPESETATKHLVCIARQTDKPNASTTSLMIQQFTTKQDLNGKILACETSSGHLQTDLDLIGKDIVDCCHSNDRQCLIRHHEQVLKNGSNTSSVYRFYLSTEHYLFIQTNSKLFRNPVSNCPEFIMSTHSIVRECDNASEMAEDTASDSFIRAIIGSSTDRDVSDDSLLTSIGLLLTSSTNVDELLQLMPNAGVVDSLCPDSHNPVATNQQALSLGALSMSGISDFLAKQAVKRTTSTSSQRQTVSCKHVTDATESSTRSEMIRGSKGGTVDAGIWKMSTMAGGETKVSTVDAGITRISTATGGITKMSTVDSGITKASTTDAGTRGLAVLSGTTQGRAVGAGTKHNLITSTDLSSDPKRRRLNLLGNSHLRDLLSRNDDGGSDGNLQLPDSSTMPVESLRARHHPVSLLKQLLSETDTNQLRVATDNEAEVSVEGSSLFTYQDKRRHYTDSCAKQTQQADSSNTDTATATLNLADSEDSTLLAQLEQAIMNSDFSVEDWDNLFSQSDLLSAAIIKTSDCGYNLPQSGFGLDSVSPSLMSCQQPVTGQSILSVKSANDMQQHHLCIDSQESGSKFELSTSQQQQIITSGVHQQPFNRHMSSSLDFTMGVESVAPSLVICPYPVVPSNCQQQQQQRTNSATDVKGPFAVDVTNSHCTALQQRQQQFCPVYSSASHNVMSPECTDYSQLWINIDN